MVDKIKKNYGIVIITDTNWQLLILSSAIRFYFLTKNS